MEQYKTYLMRDGSRQIFDEDSDDAYDAWKDGEMARPSAREERQAREDREGERW